ncbi:type VI secretion system baseplate subunit TssE [Budviciaceae bacterium BWR-B9]|uniref:Type VI secretion system baseplate subunit TssE n=2 Tax=Limnobaculum TaxID=2172100 RepID=A0A9X1SLC9_9GAMM|nr:MULTISPECIES: type VI secretion system baseplate subunit TssE [Limnobaculum]MBK5142210.1 type VI secretion system baseplate subunit TssE [Limnobaculum allomyrinae]MBV7690906.1 type VI secretion system baseplate subunit TssE [Limnobaculum sp. M2-1]MCD1127443.1 type VI secretion system baseplate subunit TssE [Limnobaculum eriocheiris]
MGPSLYESLMGNFKSGIAVDEVNEQTQTILSVMDNIQRILNSRAGAIKYLPDYGLPDLSLIYQELPSSAHSLMRAIQHTLLMYEPRLYAVELTLEPGGKDMILSYTLTCHLKEIGLVRFGTYFMPEGRAILRRLTVR